MKQKLLLIIECHAHILHGLDYNTWYNGRFVEEWAEPWIIDKLNMCFSRYSQNDIKTALIATMNLFRMIAVEIAERLNFKYPKEADEYSASWVIAK